MDTDHHAPTLTQLCSIRSTSVTPTRAILLSLIRPDLANNSHVSLNEGLTHINNELNRQYIQEDNNKQCKVMRSFEKKWNDWLRNRKEEQYRTFVCLLQRSHRRHCSAILNSAVKSNLGLVRVQVENKQEGDRETKEASVRDVESAR